MGYIGSPNFGPISGSGPESCEWSLFPDSLRTTYGRHESALTMPYCSDLKLPKPFQRNVHELHSRFKHNTAISGMDIGFRFGTP